MISVGENNQQLGIIDIVSILSFIIAIQNLDENRQQSAHNDVQAANAKQERHMMEELKKLFEEQNEMLREILDKVNNN